jgi:sec-independent protein translocase protein TatB
MLSIPHLIVIFVVALVVFGPEKLPELARSLGKVMAEFRRHTNDLRSTFEGHLRDLEREADARKTGGLSTARVASPAAPQPVGQPTTSPPATVPSDPPNAAVAAPRPEATPSADSPAIPGTRKHPGDDPYLADLTNGEFAPADPGRQAEPSASSKIPERVSDGDLPST